MKRRATVDSSAAESTYMVSKLSPGDGIGIRVGLRSQILGVRVSSGAPIMEDWQRWIIAPVLKTDVRESGP